MELKFYIIKRLLGGRELLIGYYSLTYIAKFPKDFFKLSRHEYTSYNIDNLTSPSCVESMHATNVLICHTNQMIVKDHTLLYNHT